MKQLTIGKLASESGVGVETVRFYERKGLIKKPLSQVGFRKYEPQDISQIRFIKRAQELGFTLKEIEVLLNLNRDPKATCGDIQDRTSTKILEIKKKIKDLERILNSLKKIERACDKTKEAVACCRITECFEGNC